MSPLEIVDLIRMLLDEARESFVDIDFINKAVNDALLTITRQEYMKGNERYLRPLYRRGQSVNGLDMLDGDVILTAQGGDAAILYPRSCRLFLPGMNTESTDTNNRSATMVAIYVDNARYFNYINTPGSIGFYDAFGGYDFPRSGIYTITKDINHKIHFTSNNGSEKAHLWYIKYPEVFNYIDNDPVNSVGLEVPEEYHPLISMTAAEMINDIDVDELERGVPVFQNQRINLEGTAL